MAFDPERLSVIVQPIGGGGIRFFSYESDDSFSTLTGTGYFSRIDQRGARAHDLIFVIPRTAGSPYLLVVDSLDADGNGTASLTEDAPTYVPTRTVLKALDTTKDTTAALEENGRQGLFIWRDGDYSTEIAADTAEGVFVKANGVAASAGAWVRAYDDFVNVRWFGAQEGASGDRAVNSTAFLRAKTVADLVCEGRVHAPAGTWRVNSLTDMSTNSLTLTGAGRDVTIIDWHDGTPAGQQDATTKVHLFYRHSGYARIDRFNLWGLTIQSNLDDSHSITTTGAQRIFCMLLYNVDRIYLEACRFTKIRDSVLEARGCYEVVCRDNEVDQVCRAGFNASNCRDFVCQNNVIKHTDDDAIALHTIPNGMLCRNVVITGNRIEDALSGVQLLGVKNALISKNQIDRPRFRGIQIGFEWALDDPATPTVDESEISEGATTNLGVQIHDNVISDLINRTTIDAFHDTPYGIAVRNIARQDGGTLAAVPGRNDTATSTVIPLDAYAWGNGATLPQGGGIGVSVRGNKVICMREPTGTYSEMFGVEMFSKAGWVDPTMTTAILKTGYGIDIRGPHHGLDVSGNVIVGVQQGITTKAQSWSVGGDGATLINSRISHNTLIQITSTTGAAYGMNLLTETGEQDWLGTIIEGNVIDGDPECKSFYRTRPGAGATYRSDGTWTDHHGLVGIWAPAVKGAVYRSNSFRNVSRATNLPVTVLCSDNVVYCFPAAAGNDATNKGIRNVPAPHTGFKYVVVDCDPSSATFGTVFNVMLESAAAQPSSGYYLPGWTVRDQNQTNLGGGLQRIAWKRTTAPSNTAHVAGTDWVEQKVQIS